MSGRDTTHVLVTDVVVEKAMPPPKVELLSAQLNAEREKFVDRMQVGTERENFVERMQVGRGSSWIAE